MGDQIGSPGAVCTMMRTAELAQSVERKALNLVVVGSSPTFGVADFHIHLNAWRNGSA